MEFRDDLGQLVGVMGDDVRIMCVGGLEDPSSEVGTNAVTAALLVVVSLHSQRKRAPAQRASLSRPRG
jgi:hypothetical protein